MFNVNYEARTRSNVNADKVKIYYTKVYCHNVKVIFVIEKYVVDVNRKSTYLLFHW